VGFTAPAPRRIDPVNANATTLFLSLSNFMFLLLRLVSIPTQTAVDIAAAVPEEGGIP
jgi:hypothetical protein